MLCFECRSTETSIRIEDRREPSFGLSNLVLTDSKIIVCYHCGDVGVQYEALSSLILCIQTAIESKPEAWGSTEESACLKKCRETLTENEKVNSLYSAVWVPVPEVDDPMKMILVISRK